MNRGFNKKKERTAGMSRIDEMIRPEEWQALEQDVIAWRRYLHAHAELSGHEQKSAAWIAGLLTEMGIENRIILESENAVVGTIYGGQAGKGGDKPLTVGLRADFDALPIPEKTGLPFASQNEGVMHACGHDLHAALLLGCARILQAHREELKGNVRLLFQPDEENNGGAERMIAAGALKDPDVDYCLGLHVNAGALPGHIGIKYGSMYAASDGYEIEFHGLGSHGAKPEAGIDAIMVGAEFLTTVQTVVSRMVSPQDPALFTIGLIRGGNVSNQIADYVYMKGITRTYNPETRLFLRERIRRIAEHTAAMYGARAEVRINPSYTVLINDERVAKLVEQSARDVVGDEAVNIETKAQMGCEDFAYLAQAVPSCFFHLGCMNTTDPNAVNEAHNACLNPDESCLLPGVKVQVNNVLELFHRGKID